MMVILSVLSWIHKDQYKHLPKVFWFFLYIYVCIATANIEKKKAANTELTMDVKDS